MIRKIIAIVVAFSVWSVLWLGGNSLLIKPTPTAADTAPPITTTTLASLLALSVACSVASGVIANKIGRAASPVIITAILLVLVGVGVESANWRLMPIWYHLTFIAMIAPATIAGGRLIRR